MTQTMDQEAFSKCPVMGDMLLAPLLAMEATRTYKSPSQPLLPSNTISGKNSFKNQCPHLSTSSLYLTSEVIVQENLHKTQITSPKTTMSSELYASINTQLSARLSELLELRALMNPASSVIP